MKYREYIVRYYASHDDIPAGHQDGEIIAELVRCKDCKFSKAYYHGPESNLGMFTYLCQGLYDMNADDYCSFGGDIPPEYEDEDGAYERKKYGE